MLYCYALIAEFVEFIYHSKMTDLAIDICIDRFKPKILDLLSLSWHAIHDEVFNFHQKVTNISAELTPVAYLDQFFRFIISSARPFKNHNFIE